MEEFKIPEINNEIKISQEEWDKFQKDLRIAKFQLQEINDNLSGRIDFKNLLKEGIKGFNVKDGEITADKLSVITLSAITADLGTITAGDITLDDEGFIRTAGKDDYADDTAGFWLGYDTDKYKLNIGNATDYLKWTGSAIQIKSSSVLSNINVSLGTITAGNITLDSSGFIRTTGKDNYADTTAGFWLGYDAGAYKFNIGNSANWLKWTGSALQIKGRLSVGGGTSEDIYFEDSAIRMYDDLDGTKKKIGWRYGDLKFGEFFYNTDGKTHFVLRSGTDSYSTVLYSRASDNTGFVFILGPTSDMPCWIRLNPQGHIVLSAVPTAPDTNVTFGSFSYNSVGDRPTYRDSDGWRYWIGETGW